MSQQIKDKFKFKMSQENENKIASYNFIKAPTKLFYVLNKDCYSLLLLLIEKESYWKTKNELKDGYFYITISEIEDILNVNQKDINLLIETLYINKLIEVISEGTRGQKRTNKFKVNWKTITDYDKYSLTDIRTLKIFIPKLKRGTICTYHTSEKVRTFCPHFDDVVEEVKTKVKTNCPHFDDENHEIDEVKTNCPQFEPKVRTKVRTKCLTTIDNIDNTEEKKENIKKELTYVSNTDKPRLTNIEGTNVDFFENYLEVEDLNLSELNELNLTDIEGTRVNSLPLFEEEKTLNYSTEESLNLTDSTETYINSFLNYLEEEEKEEKETSEAITYSTEKESSFTDIKTNVNSLPLFEEEKTLNYSTEKESSFTDSTETSEAITLQPKNVLKVEDISEAKKETPLVALVPPLNKPIKKSDREKTKEVINEENNNMDDEDKLLREYLRITKECSNLTNNFTKKDNMLIINDFKEVELEINRLIDKEDIVPIFDTIEEKCLNIVTERIEQYYKHNNDLDKDTVINYYVPNVLDKYKVDVTNLINKLHTT